MRKLLRRLYPMPAQSASRFPPPDWSQVHRELRRKGVTLALLWEEYKTVHPEVMQYSWFCRQYRVPAPFRKSSNSAGVKVSFSSMESSSRGL